MKKLRGHNKSPIDLSNANPARGRKEVRRSAGHIMVAAHYSNQQGSKSRQARFNRPRTSETHRCQDDVFGHETVYQTSLFHIGGNLDRLGLLSPTHGQRSQQQSGQSTLQSVLVNKPKFLKATHNAEIRKYRGLWWWRS